MKRGFTVVELLIVIVVIGVLATLTIIAYSGVQDNARRAALQSDLSQSAKRLEEYKLKNAETFPANLAAAQAAGIIKPSGSNAMSYTAYATALGANTAYCVQSSNAGLNYYTIAGGLPVAGTCGTITNESVNPSFETNTTGVSAYQVSNARVCTGGYSGNCFLRSTRTTTTGTNGPWWDTTSGTIIPGNTYYIAIMARQNHTQVRSFRVEWRQADLTGINVATIATFDSSSASWTLIGGNVVAPANAANVRLTLYGADAGTTADYVDIDSVIVVNTTSQYRFYDGASANWSWSGTVNNSASSGPVY